MKVEILSNRISYNKNDKITQGLLEIFADGNNSIMDFYDNFGKCEIYICKSLLIQYHRDFDGEQVTAIEHHLNLDGTHDDEYIEMCDKYKGLYIYIVHHKTKKVSLYKISDDASTLISNIDCKSNYINYKFNDNPAIAYFAGLMNAVYRDECKCLDDINFKNILNHCYVYYDIENNTIVKRYNTQHCEVLEYDL